MSIIGLQRKHQENESLCAGLEKIRILFNIKINII